MNIADVTCGERGFTITWDDRSVAEFPFIWLRDNAPEEFHPDTLERVFDLTTVELGIAPDAFTVKSDALVVRWPEIARPSAYPARWLRKHRPGRMRPDPANVERKLWQRDGLTTIPGVAAQHCLDASAALHDALRTLKRFGILIVGGLEDSPDASKVFGDLIGFRRRTNFGDMFEVVSKPAPNNLAYTSLALPLHTDLPNQEIIPGYQLLHCYRNSASGGESIFADGFRICNDLRREAPADYDLLKNTAVPWRFYDDCNDIRQHRPIIGERPDGKLDYFAFNAHIADLPDMDPATLYEFYAAYQRLMRRMREPRYAVCHALQAGEMVVFDNTRVVHGRASFDPDSGERHLCGYYLERNEVDSRIRVLSRH